MVLDTLYFWNCHKMAMLRPKPAGGVQHECILAAGLIRVVAISILVFSFVFSQDSLPNIDICLFHAITGLQCAGCGMTRAFCSISHGQFAQAWSLNPFSYFFYALVLLGLAFPSLINLLPEKLIIAITLMVTAALLAFGIFRIVAGLG
jgi:hypothetical protein